MRIGVILWCLFGLATPLFAQTATVIGINPKASATANGQVIKIGATLSMGDNIDFTAKDAVLTVLVGKERAFVKQKGVLKNVLSNSSNMEITFGARDLQFTKKALKDFFDNEVVGDEAPLYIAVLDTLRLPIAANYVKMHAWHGKPKAPYFQLAYTFMGKKVQKPLPVGKKNDICIDHTIFIVGEYVANHETAKEMELQLVNAADKTTPICKTRLRFLHSEEMQEELGAILAHLRQSQPTAKQKDILDFIKNHIDTQYGKIDADNLLLWLKKHFELPKD